MKLGVTRETGGLYVFHCYIHALWFHYGTSEIKVAEQRGHGTVISQVRSISIGHPISNFGGIRDVVAGTTVDTRGRMFS